VSWPLASFLVVAVVLGAGWLAYERRRPSARMAAVVAVMAALAALGRDAFAALPDVKPITAMTLVVGYALGPLPGFTVGALGMLVSNFMLGQGPYTPWQMAAWGMVGLAGAALGALSRRRLGRLPLACACAVTALAAKEIMNLYTWTLGASHTPAAFLLVAGQALAYDVTDMVASFLFGLAFAPELARVLERMRVRMDVRWEEPNTTVGLAAGARAPGRATLGPLASLAALALAAGVLLGCSGSSGPHASASASPPAATAPTTVAAGDPPHATIAPGASARAPTKRADAARARTAHAGGSTSPASRAAAGGLTAASPRRAAGAAQARVGVARELAFLAHAQNPDGGFGGARGQASSELYTAWVAIGLAAAGRDPRSMRRGGHSVLDALRGEAATLQGAGDLERTILALHACGVSVRSLPASAGAGAGGNPVSRLLAMRAGDGSIGDLANLTAFGVLALRAGGYGGGDPVVRAAARWLAQQQNADGGFGFAAAGGPSDVDDTAAALQALVAAGARAGAVAVRARSFLLHAQNLDGGFPQQPGGASNAQSTAWAIQGLTAAGRNPDTVTRAGSRSPVAYLESLLSPDGSVRYSRTGAQTPVWVTAQALTGLLARPLPIAPVG